MARRILTLNTDPENLLRQPSPAMSLTVAGLAYASQIIQDLKDAAKEHWPLAGIAAPQVGHKARIFIFSWNREFDTLAAAINPTFSHLSEEKTSEWEACLSSASDEDPPLYIAKVPRYASIKASYYDLSGKKVTAHLQDYAARIYQHELNHLDGILHFQLPGVEVKTFQTKPQLVAFATAFRKTTPINMVPPKIIGKTGE